MADRKRPGMSWEQMERASLAAEQADYRSSTPGQRVEDVIRLSRFAGEIAAAGDWRRAKTQ